MTEHSTGTREEWRSASVELVALEKEHTRRADELARMRRDEDALLRGEGEWWWRRHDEYEDGKEQA